MFSYVLDISLPNIDIGFSLNLTFNQCFKTFFLAIYVVFVHIC